MKKEMFRVTVSTTSDGCILLEDNSDTGHGGSSILLSKDQAGLVVEWIKEAISETEVSK